MKEDVSIPQWLERQVVTHSNDFPDAIVMIAIVNVLVTVGVMVIVCQVGVGVISTVLDIVDVRVLT